jgi:hypothetical protein
VELPIIRPGQSRPGGTSANHGNGVVKGEGLAHLDGEGVSPPAEGDENIPDPLDETEKVLAAKNRVQVNVDERNIRLRRTVPAS